METLFTALPFTTFVTAVAIPEGGPLGVVWSDNVDGSFFTPVNVNRRVRMSERRVKLQESGRTGFGGNTFRASLPLSLM